MSGENHHRSFLGKTHSTETKMRMSEAHSGENNPMFDKAHSEETKTLMSEARSGENHPMFGLSHSDITKSRMSAAKGGSTIYVYSKDKSSLVYSFPSARKAAKILDSNHNTIKKYALNGETFKDKYILSTNLITQEDSSSKPSDS